MAKPTKKDKAPKALTATLATAGISLDSKLDTSDVLAIVVSKAEQTFRADLKLAIDAKNKAQQELSDIQKAIPKEIQRAIEEAVIPNLGQLEEALKPWDCKIVRSGNIAHNKASVIVINVHVQRNDEKGNHLTFKHHEIPTPQIVLDLQKECVVKLELTNKLEQEALTARRKLADIPVLERQYRAKLAATKLSESEAGQALLRTLTGNLEADIAGFIA